MTRPGLTRAAALAATLAVATGGCNGGSSRKAPPGPTDTVDDRGLLDLNNTATYFGQSITETDDLDLIYDANTVGALVYAQADPPGDKYQYVFTSTINNPDGSSLVQAGSNFSDLAAYQQLRAPVRPELFVGSSSFSFPESDDDSLARGTYKFRVAAIASQVHVWVVRRTGAQPMGGTLDLNLFFVAGCGYTSADMTSIQKALDSMQSVLSQGNLTLGTISTFDITGSDAANYVALSADDLSTTQPIRELLTLSSRGAAGSYNIFFVKSIDESGSGGYILQGLSMGIPAALAVQGTFASGSIISIDGHRETGTTVNLNDMGLTMAHETSHSLGLFHTTEAATSGQGAGHDLISDTPECPASADHNHDGMLTPDECAGYDANNFMFWTGSGNTLTPGQGSVITRAVVVH